MIINRKKRERDAFRRSPPITEFDDGLHVLVRHRIMDYSIDRFFAD